MLESDANKQNRLHNDSTEPYTVKPPERRIENEQTYREYGQPPVQSTGAYRPVPVQSPAAPVQVPYGPALMSQQGTGAYRPLSTYGEAPAPQQQPVPPVQAGVPHSNYQPGTFAQGGNVPPTTPFGPGSNGGRPPRKGLRTGAILLLTLVIASVFATGLFAGWQFGRTSVTPYASTGLQSSQQNNQTTTVPQLNGNNIQEVRAAVVSKVRPAVVQINVSSSRGSSLGSGVIIDKRGYIVTNNHVVEGARSVEVVLFDGSKLSGKVVGNDPADDLAIVQISPTTNMTVISIGDSSKAIVGQEVLAIGNPLGNTQTVTNGIISALGRNVSEGNGVIIPNTIQTDAPINPGNSGGALVDLQGNLVGIPTLTALDPEFNAPANGVGFAIPSNRVKFIAPQLIDNGKVLHTGRAAIGIRMTEVDANIQNQANLTINHGILITEIVAGGAAEKAGLRAGDVITSIDNKVVNTRSELSDALLAKNVGEQVSIKAQRGNQQMTFNVTLGELKAD